MASLAPHCQTLMEAKQASGKTFAEIAAAIGKPEVWTAALFFGNAVTDAETAAKIATEIGLKDEVAVKGLAGKGPGSLGVDGMIVRGQNWEWPPKVSSVVSLPVCVCPAVCGRALSSAVGLRVPAVGCRRVHYSAMNRKLRAPYLYRRNHRRCSLPQLPSALDPSLVVITMQRPCPPVEHHASRSMSGVRHPRMRTRVIPWTEDSLNTSARARDVLCCRRCAG